MKKNIEWLKKEISTEMIELEPIRRERWADVKYQTLRGVAQKIYQLDEPEVTHEQVVEWIENNEFYCHATAETVLENAVDKGELGYYGTKYSVVEKPVIPKYVAEYIDLVKIDIPLMKILEVANRRNELPEWKKEYDWISENSETFARAWLDGYEVEEEPLYYALAKGHELTDGNKVYWVHDKNNDDMFIGILHSPSVYFLSEMSKSEWNELGINSSNADFVKVV